MKRKSQTSTVKLSLQKHTIVNLSGNHLSGILGGDTIVIKDTNTRPLPDSKPQPKPTVEAGGTKASLFGGNDCTVMGH